MEYLIRRYMATVSFNALAGWAVCWKRDVFPVRYKPSSYILLFPLGWGLVFRLRNKMTTFSLNNISQLGYEV
jgi:hypothetical protein